MLLLIFCLAFVVFAKKKKNYQRSLLTSNDTSFVAIVNFTSVSQQSVQNWSIALHTPFSAALSLRRLVWLRFSFIECVFRMRVRHRSLYWEHRTCACNAYQYKYIHTSFHIVHRTWCCLLACLPACSCVHVSMCLCAAVAAAVLLASVRLLHTPFSRTDHTQFHCYRKHQPKWMFTSQVAQARSCCNFLRIHMHMHARIHLRQLKSLSKQHIWHPIRK